MKQPYQGLFVVGSDTEVGKTYVASLIVKSLLANTTSIGVYKPVASGCSFRNGKLWSPDTQQLWEAAGRPRQLRDVTPQFFAAPVAPHVAARLEEKAVDASLLRSGLEVWADYPAVVVEGVGGLLSPISDSDLVADLAVEFAYPLVIVVPNTLGAINQTLLTLVAAEKYHLPVAGVILNEPLAYPDDSSRSNASEIRNRIGVPLLAHVRHNAVEMQIDAAAWM